MFISKKTRVVFAIICAAATMMVNVITPLAAPYGYSSIEDVRSKALSNYLSSNKIITAINAKAPVSEGVIPEITEDGALVTYSTVTEIQPVGYSIVKRINAALDKGETVTVREGVEGERTVVYSIRYENGVEVSREVEESYVTKPAVSKVVDYGTDNAMEETGYVSECVSVDVSKLDYAYYIDCEATAYDLSAEENGGYAGQSATGVPLDKGVIAVDPSVIPLGTRVYIEAIDGSWSYGYAVAADTGGAIKGKRVDLCHRTQYECIQFGRRPCRVYILN